MTADAYRVRERERESPSPHQLVMICARSHNEGIITFLRPTPRGALWPRHSRTATFFSTDSVACTIQTSRRSSFESIIIWFLVREKVYFLLAIDYTSACVRECAFIYGYIYIL